MPLPGGSADKIGNRFELWWTALCLVDILDERAERILIEPPGELGDGIEFVLIRKGVREYHQVKRQTTKALGWSIAALGASDVLKHIPAKIGGTRDEFHFVSTMAAPELTELSENARQAADFGCFRTDFLGVGKRMGHWNDLAAQWQPRSEHDCYDILQGVRLDSISEDVLRNQVLARASALVDGPERQVANELVGLALDSVNASLTADMVWNHLRGVGLPRRNWVNEPHVLKALADNNQRFLESRRREFFRELFPQPLAPEIINDLLSTHASHTLVSAPAGGGKSGLLVQVIEDLERNGIPFLAVRLDRLDPTLRTTAQIGGKIDLPGSPVSLLGAIAQERRSVLILDQLDAVSLISGKNPDLFDPVCDLFEEASGFPEMRVLAACRAFDLDNDHRLKKLAANPIFVRRGLNPLAREYVLKGIEEAGFEPSGLSVKQIELFSNPLSLSMLAEIRPASQQPVGIETSIDLFDAFWKRKKLDLAQLGVTSDQSDAAIDTLCELLEKRGALFVPEPSFTHSARDKLASAHILSLNERKWSFFHESFYDFANARRLYRSGKSLPSYLKERGQGIELRNQLRQSLAFRRAYDRSLYLGDVKELLADPGIRFHLKSATIAFLRSLPDPTGEEWDLLESLMQIGPASDLTRGLFTVVGLSPPWFRLACDSGAVSRWLGSPHSAIRNLLAWALTRAERRDPEEAIPALKEVCAAGPEGKRLAAGVLEYSELAAIRSVFDFYLELFLEGLYAAAGQESSVPWLPLYGIASKKPEWACEVLGILLRKAVQIASSRGARNPFAPGIGVLTEDQLDEEVIRRMHQGAPVKFFDETWPSILDVVAANLDQEASSKPPYRDKIWEFYHPEFNHSLQEKIISGTEVGIKVLAATDFERFSLVADAAASLNAATVQCLLVAGFASAGQNHPEEALTFLLADTSRFCVGWSNDSVGPARELIRAASQGCSEITLASLQTVLLDWYPWWERTIAGRRSFGYSQYRLLSSITEPRRSQPVRRRLQEWERKFDSLQETPATSYIGLRGAVSSPIRPRAADKMTDEQWLAAIAKYSPSTFNVRPDGTTNSGLLGLAQEILRVARNDPMRFAMLMDRFPKATNLAYFEAIIMAVADESVPAETAMAVCRVGHQLDGKPLGQWIPYCIGKTCLKGPSPEAVSMTCEYCLPPFSEEVRRSALLNLGNLLRADRARIQTAFPYLEHLARHVPRELRSDFCYTLTPLFGTPFQPRIKDLFQPMWSADRWLPADHSVEPFLGFAFRAENGEFKEIMEALLGAGEVEMRGMAARQAAIMALVAKNVPDITPKLVAGDQYVRKGFAQVCAANVRFGKFRDYCVHYLSDLFSDLDPSVRIAASGCFRDLEGENLADLWDLVAAFLDSPSAETSLRSLLDSLSRSTVRHELLTLRACERAIEHTVHGKDVAYSELSLCRDLILRTYHQCADTDVRKRSLDLIDRLLGLDVEGVETALLEIEARR